jgi:hypothetical protein
MAADKVSRVLLTTVLARVFGCLLSFAVLPVDDDDDADDDLGGCHNGVETVAVVTSSGT